MIQVFCDGSITGGSWANKHQRLVEPVPTIWGGWYAEKLGGIHIHHDSHCFGARDTNSSTLAEYFAVRSALYWLSKHGYTTEPLQVFSDSQVCVFQLTGQYRCKTPNLKCLLESCKKLETAFPEVTYTWVRREFMREADVLSKALQTWGYVPTWEEVLASV